MVRAETMLRFALYCLRETGTVGEEERVGKSRKRVVLRETLEEIQEENIKGVGESIRGRLSQGTLNCRKVKASHSALTAQIPYMTGSSEVGVSQPCTISQRPRFLYFLTLPSLVCSLLLGSRGSRHHIQTQSNPRHKENIS